MSSADPPLVAPAKLRLPWIDATRGAAVAAVVLFHVCIWHFLPIVRDGGESPVTLRFWSLLNGVVSGFRMPVLLTVSGMLVARRMQEGFGRTRRAAAGNVYLYLVWVVVYALVSLAVPQHMPQEITSGGDALKQVLVPETTLWYVYALAVYSVVLTALRKVPSWAVLAPLAVLNVLAFTYPPGIGFWGKIMGLAVYFAVGVRCGTLFRRSVEHVKSWRTALLVILSVVLVYCDRFTPNRVTEVTFTLLRNVLIVFMAVAVVAMLVRLRPLGRLGVYLGQRTLGVYVIHAPVVQLLYVAGAGPLAPRLRWLAGHELLALLYPVAVTVLVILACLGLEKLLRRAGARWLFLLPGPIRDRLEQPGPPLSPTTATEPRRGVA